MAPPPTKTAAPTKAAAAGGGAKKLVRGSADLQVRPKKLYNSKEDAPWKTGLSQMTTSWSTIVCCVLKKSNNGMCRQLFLCFQLFRV